MNGFNGVEPPTLPLDFSFAEAGSVIKSSSSTSCRLRPQILNATIANPASRIAPPIPTTTPIIVFLAFELRPELEELLLPESRLGTLVDDALPLDTGSSAEVVRT